MRVAKRDKLPSQSSRPKDESIPVRRKLASLMISVHSTKGPVGGASSYSPTILIGY